MRIEGNIAVLGAGAIGGAIAAYLTKDGYDITVIDPWADNINAIRKNGLKLTDVNEPFVVKLRSLHLSDLGAADEQFDVVFLSVKSYDTKWASTFIEPHLKPTGYVLPAQNGMNDDAVAEIVGYNRTVGCVPTISSAIYDPGHVVRTDPVSGLGFHVGELNGTLSPRALAVAKALNVIGPADATTNIWGSRWSKLIVNCQGNAPSGLIGPSPEQMNDDQKDLLNLVGVAIGAEVLKVGTSLGITFEHLMGSTAAAPLEEFLSANSLADLEAIKSKAVSGIGGLGLTDEQRERLGVPGRASLLQDVIKGRRTEARYLNGYVVEKGQLAGVPTPVNQGVVELMERIESGDLEPSVNNVDLLEKYLPS